MKVDKLKPFDKILKYPFLRSNSLQQSMIITNLTLYSQDDLSNSPYCLSYNSYDVSLQNWVLDHLTI